MQDDPVPAVVITEHDARLLARPDIRAIIDDAVARPERLIRNRPRSAVADANPAREAKDAVR